MVSEQVKSMKYYSNLETAMYAHNISEISATSAVGNKKKYVVITKVGETLYVRGSIWKNKYKEKDRK